MGCCPRWNSESEAPSRGFGRVWFYVPDSLGTVEPLIALKPGDPVEEVAFDVADVPSYADGPWADAPVSPVEERLARDAEKRGYLIRRQHRSGEPLTPSADGHMPEPTRIIPVALLLFHNGMSGGMMPKSAREVIAENVRRLRREHDWTQEEVARRLTRAGWPTTQSKIAKVERGTSKPKLSVDDLLALAFVLDTTPTNLVVPWDPDAEVQITPHVNVTGAKGRQWFRGWEPLPEQDRDRFSNSVPRQDWYILHEPFLLPLVDAVEQESLLWVGALPATPERLRELNLLIGGIAMTAHMARENPDEAPDREQE